jgi:hypothetical protein
MLSQIHSSLAYVTTLEPTTEALASLWTSPRQRAARPADVQRNPPERHRTLAEVCDLYFPGISPCALLWMIKRKGYPHSRWGREYRLTDSQVAAIQARLASEGRPDPSRRSAPRDPDSCKAKIRRRASKPPREPPHGMPSPARRREPVPLTDPRQALTEHFCAPLAAPEVDTHPWHREGPRPPGTA